MIEDRSFAFTSSRTVQVGRREVLRLLRRDPGSLNDVGELYAGGVAAGNACVAVRAGADGLWTVSAGWSDPVFFTTATA